MVCVGIKRIAACVCLQQHPSPTPTVVDINPALPSGPYTMGIMVHSLPWVMQDLYHQPYVNLSPCVPVFTEQPLQPLHYPAKSFPLAI